MQSHMQSKSHNKIHSTSRKKIGKNFIVMASVMLSMFVFVAGLVPVQVSAAPSGMTSFVPDDCYKPATQDKDTGQLSVKCGWNQLVELGQNILRNAIYLAVMIGTVAIVYAGYLFMSAGDNESTRKEAKGILWNVVLGIVYTMVAWLLVWTILNFLGVESSFRLLE